MDVRIHRGAHEIGGNCIEVRSGSGEQIVLDIGRPLGAGWDDEIALPPVPGLVDPDDSLLGIVLSHPHLDHYGLLAQVSPDVPVFMGEEAAAVVNAAAFFSPISGSISPTGHLRHREPFELGPLRITPFLNDHSAFDAYSLLIEADGRSLFYTGDLRAHGRKAAMFEELLRKPPSADVLLMEGTHVRADGAHDAEFETETDLEDRFVETIRATKGAVVVLGSAQNLDRLVTVFRATKRAERDLVVDLYGATVAAATRPTIPQPGFDRLRVWVPQRQRVRVKQSGEFDRIDWIKPWRAFPGELAKAPERFVFHVPSSSVYELLTAGVLTPDGLAVWSLWGGYLHQPSGKKMAAALDQADVPLTSLHTSGHASVADLRRLRKAIDPATVVPIHSEATHRFVELFDDVQPHSDGEWWEL